MEQQPVVPNCFHNFNVNVVKANKRAADHESQCDRKCHFEGSFLRHLTKSTVCRHKVPILFQEPYIRRGYRLIGKPWLYYIASVFQLHNESVNIWSHVLASILVLQKFKQMANEHEFLTDPVTWPMLAGIISSFMLFGLSCTAHSLQSKSPLAHHVTFMFDYAGVGLHALGSVIVFLEYSSTDEFFYIYKDLSLFVGIPLSCLACIGCCLSKVIYDRPYPFARKLWQIVPIAGIYVLLISPVAHRMYLCMLSNQCFQSFYLHIQHIIWFLLSGFFFSCQFPQSLAPVGACDHFFHGHQLFHFAIMASILTQIDAVNIDFKTFERSIRSRPEPTFSSAFGPIVFVWCFELLSIFVLYFLVKKKLTSKDYSCRHNN